MAEDNIKGIFDNKAYQGLTSHVRTSIRELLTFKTTDVPELVKIFGSKDIPSDGVTDEQAKQLVKFYTKARYPGIGDEVATAMSDDLKKQSPTLFKRVEKVAEITKDSTLREILETYQSRQGRGPEFVTEGLKLFKDVADKPGSALDLFRPDDDGRTLAGKRFKAKELQNIEDGLDKGSGLIGPMKSIRLVGVDLKGVLGPKDNMYQYLPDEKTNTVVNKRIFEIKEPPKPVSLVAVNPNKKVLNELFVKVAEFKKNPQLEAVADALLFNIQNGLRANAAAGLQIGDYFPENMSIYIDAEAKGAKGKSVSVPLGALADSILQDRIKNNKVKEIDGVKHFFVKPNGKKVTSTDMTALLKRIKVDNILYDQKKKKYYNSLAPLDDAPGKTGSPLIRNLHTQLAFNADIVGGEGRIAYLQGRSLTSVKMDEVGDLIKYKVDFPGAIDPDGIDARNANKIGNIFAKSAKKFGYDLSGKVPRITEKTEGFSDYFKSPVIDKVKDVPEKILTPKTPQDIVSSITAEEKEKLKLLGINVEEAFKNVKKGAKTPKGLKSIDPFAIVAGGAGVSEILGDTGELVGEEITQSTIAQTLAKTAPKLAQTALGKALPVAGAGIIFPTSPTNVDEVEGFARKDIDTRFGGIDQMDTSQEKRIFKDDPRLQGATAMYDPSELPRRDADDPLSDEAYRKRFLEKSRTKASSRLRGFAQPR